MSPSLSCIVACALLATQAPEASAPAGVSPSSRPSPSAAAASPFDGVDARPAVLVLSLEPAGVSSSDAGILDGMIANALSRHHAIEVVTAEELTQLMELEGQRQSVGCDTTSCLGEIAGAMGARYVLFGKAGRLGELFVVQLNLFDSTEAQAVARREIQASAIHDLAPQVQPAVDALVGSVTGATVSAPVAAQTLERGPNPLLFVGGGAAALGAVLAGGAGIMLGVWLAQLNDPDTFTATKDVAASGAPFALGTVAVGATMLVGGAGLAAFSWGME